MDDQDPTLSLCPRCGSFDVDPDPLTPLGQLYKCRDCGYQGAFIIEAESVADAQRIQEEIQADGDVV